MKNVLHIIWDLVEHQVLLWHLDECHYYEAGDCSLWNTEGCFVPVWLLEIKWCLLNLTGITSVGRRCKASGRDVPTRREGNVLSTYSMNVYFYIIFLLLLLLIFFFFRAKHQCCIFICWFSCLNAGWDFLGFDHPRLLGKTCLGYFGVSAEYVFGVILNGSQFSFVFQFLLSFYFRYFT